MIGGAGALVSIDGDEPVQKSSEAGDYVNGRP